MWPPHVKEPFLHRQKMCRGRQNSHDGGKQLLQTEKPTLSNLTTINITHTHKKDVVCVLSE